MILPLYHHKFLAMGGDNEIQLYAKDQSQARNLSLILEQEVKEVEGKYSRYLDQSIISKINSSAGSGKTIEVDNETATLLDYAAVCYEQSEGLFDITSGILRRAWNFKEPSIPTVEQVKELLKLIGWRKVIWRRPYITLPLMGMEIDFGGIGKEYAADRCAAVCMKLNIRHCMINLAGDIRVIGASPDGSPWKIGVTHPRDREKVVDVIEIKRGAITTSGDYERYFIKDGARYCHILNPKTGYPVSEVQSVTVIGDSCLVAGSACTIAMLLGAAQGESFLKKLGLPGLLIGGDGVVKRIRGGGLLPKSLFPHQLV